MARRVYQGGGVYVLVHRRTRRVMRVGHTCDLQRRQKEHARDAALGCFDFVARYWVDGYAARRGLEQLLHDELNPPLDKVRPIDPRNPRREKYLAAARRFLQA